MKTKTLVLYAYFECKQFCVRHFKYFTRVGINEIDDTDFLIIVNGNCTYCETKEFMDKLIFKNVKIIYKKNVGYDFGGWSYGILHAKILE